MVRTGIFAPLAAAALVAASADAFTLTITNNCGSTIDVYLRQGSVYTDSYDTLANGASTQKTIEKGFEGHFRNGSSTAATLVEFSTGGDMDFVWHDISIIPPELTAGHEYCTSLDDCKANSASGIGYNTPVRLTPLANTNGDSCRELDCLADYCEDAYLYPTDDLKTHACALDTDFELTFCPDGSSTAATASSQTTAPETESPAVTSAPTEAPAATTAAPAETTAAPAETTAAPVAATDAPVATTAAPAATTAAPASTDDTDAYDDTTGDEGDSSSTPAPTTAATDATTSKPKSKFCH